MDGNTELLNYIYQNSQMGLHSIEQLLKKTEDGKFKNHLSTQHEEYKAINTQARELLKEKGHEEKDLGAMAKLTTQFSINVNTLTDHSPSHMAEMMMQGSTMGIIDATKNLNKYANADEAIISLGRKLLRTEESNVEHLKGFLQ